MLTGYRLPAIVMLFVISLATVHPSVWAAKPVLPATLTAMVDHATSLKGIVTATAEKSLTIREGNTALQVNVTDTTQVTGQRASFGKIMVGDIVRVDGRMNPERQWLAGRIEVLFAAGPTVGAPSTTSIINHLLSQAPALAGLLSVLVNGGVTVMLP